MNAIVRARLGLKDKLWVKAKEVMALTGWDYNDMARARMYKYITVEKRTNNATGRVSFFYDINSLDPRLIKAPSLSSATDTKPALAPESGPDFITPPQEKYKSAINKIDNILAALAMLQNEAASLRKELAAASTVTIPNRRPLS